MQESGLKRFHFETAVGGSRAVSMVNNCSFSVSSCDARGAGNLESSPYPSAAADGRFINQSRVITEIYRPAVKYGEQQFCENQALARDPRRRPLIFSTIGNLAFFAAGYKLENNLFTTL